jgi:hypothetical protein
MEFLPLLHGKRPRQQGCNKLLIKRLQQRPLTLAVVYITLGTAFSKHENVHIVHSPS